MPFFGTRRSAGVPVSRPVHRLISRGNAARDREDWPEAARFYRAALAEAPNLAHIQVQLGHAEKEGGDRDAAEAAYREARRLAPDSADAALQLGHLLSLRKRRGEALDAYLDALRLDRNQADAAAALHRALEHATGRRRDAIMAALSATLDGADRPEPPHPAAALPGTACVFDISDLLQFWQGSRAPTGIQRVQTEIVSEALAHPGGPVRLCCFIVGRDDWLEVPPGRFDALRHLAATGTDRADPNWTRALNGLYVHLALAPAMAFPPGAVLLNLGSSWSLPNYFLRVRWARARHGVRYVPLVHDLISALQPRHFLRKAREEIVPWFLGVMDHADALLAVSEATKRDLLRVAGMTGRTLRAEDVSVVRLDADFRKAPAEGGPALPAPGQVSGRAPGQAAQHGRFALFVATVESRKGHGQALDAWSGLLRRLGPERVPRLVCVGRRGWLSGEVYARLEADPRLAAHVSMRAGVSDVELAALYAACLFTIYPSHAEGWGLPVTESLCFGKPVITTDSSSLPEAGGPFAVYVPPGNPAALEAAVERMATDDAFREARAAHIRAEFRPRTWRDLATGVQEAARRLPAATAPRAAPPARLGFFHPLRRATELRLWSGSGDGEIFRDGAGWAVPDGAGCRVRPGGGTLRIGVPVGHGELRLGLLLLADPKRDTGWEIDLRHGSALSGTLEAGRRKWVVLDYPPAPDGGELRLRLRGVAPEDPRDPPTDDAPEAAAKPDGRRPPAAAATAAATADEDDEAGPGGPPPALPGLAGFFLHAADDADATWRLHEAIALGNLDDVDAFRAPERTPERLDWRPNGEAALQPPSPEAL